MYSVRSCLIIEDKIKQTETSVVATIQGKFRAVESFAIRRRNEFYIIGYLEEGEVQEQWFARVTLNLSLALTLRITQIETVETTNEKQEYQLLIIAADSEAIDLLLGLNIGLEPIAISTEGED